MTNLFDGATNFTIHGGTFNNVAGNLTQYNTRTYFAAEINNVSGQGRIIRHNSPTTITYQVAPPRPAVGRGRGDYFPRDGDEFYGSQVPPHDFGRRPQYSAPPGPPFRSNRTYGHEGRPAPYNPSPLARPSRSDVWNDRHFEPSSRFPRGPPADWTNNPPMQDSQDMYVDPEPDEEDTLSDGGSEEQGISDEDDGESADGDDEGSEEYSSEYESDEEQDPPSTQAPNRAFVATRGRKPSGTRQRRKSI